MPSSPMMSFLLAFSWSRRMARRDIAKDAVFTMLEERMWFQAVVKCCERLSWNEPKPGRFSGVKPSSLPREYLPYRVSPVPKFLSMRIVPWLLRLRAMRLSRKLFESMPAPTTVGTPFVDIPFPEPPIVLGRGAYLFSMVAATGLIRLEGIALFGNGS